MKPDDTTDKADGLLAPGQTDTLNITTAKDEKIGRALAKVTLDPQTRNASLATAYGSQVFGVQKRPTMAESSMVMGDELHRASQGDLSLASRIYTAQAIALDTMFTDLARRAGENMGQYPAAVDRYLKLAFKAQSACRVTLDSLARLHQPREQTVKHVHINDGGQAVVVDHLHQTTGGTRNGKTDEQSHATDDPGASAALPSPNPLGTPMPSARRPREA